MADGTARMPRPSDPVLRTFAGLAASVLIFAALREAASVFVPATFALFIIAVVWPLQRTLQRVLPKPVALLLTLVTALIAVIFVVFLMSWGFTRLGQWAVANAGRFQDAYKRYAVWLDGHGVPAAGLIADTFDMRWLVWMAQGVTGQVRGLFSFMTVTLIFVMLGLLEVEVCCRNLLRIGREPDSRFLAASAEIAGKMQTYMIIRTIMSAVTGIAVWAFASTVGLDLPLEWGVIAFAMNYIPFLGPLVATLFPSLFAILQFGSWEMPVAVFLCLNIVQFLSGSVIEPRLAGRALSVSPFLVLFAVFFWAFLWGIAGAFIGVPITIAALTLAARYDATRGISDLLSGRA